MTLTISEFQENFTRVTTAISQVMVGQENIVQGVLVALFAGGHVLLEGLPGLGKTLLVQTMAQVLELSNGRIQFTPDLMPADITGTNVLLKAEDHPVIEFEKGPVFANVVLADEINRATPRTQSALLEAMQEGNVTAGGKTYPLPSPFMVVATQNPIEMEGTYPLPEAQLDRFFFKIEVAFPNLGELVEIARRTTAGKLPKSTHKLPRETIDRMKNLVLQVCISPYLTEYAARLVLTTQSESEYAIPMVKKYVQYGASPRGMQALILGAKVKALLAGREHVAKEDMLSILAPALCHRIAINFEGEAEGATPAKIVDRLIASVEV